MHVIVVQRMEATALSQQRETRAPVGNSLLLDAQFCFALYSASRRVVRAYNGELKKLGLTYPQYLVMLVLWEWDHDAFARPSIGELGRRLDFNTGTTTPLVKRLEVLGLATRVRQADDERQVFVQLTQAGRSLYQQALKVPPALLQMSSLPAEQLMLLRDQLNQI